MDNAYFSSVQKFVFVEVYYVIYNIFKVLIHTQERKILIQKTYKNFNVAGLGPAPPGNQAGSVF